MGGLDLGGRSEAVEALHCQFRQAADQPDPARHQARAARSQPAQAVREGPPSWQKGKTSQVNIKRINAWYFLFQFQLLKLSKDTNNPDKLNQSD